MFLKIMSREDAADDDSRKMFRLLDHVTSAEFIRASGKNAGKASVAVVFQDGSHEEFDCPSNAYLMNAEGVTVAAFGSAPYRRMAA